MDDGARRDHAALATAYDREWRGTRHGQPYTHFWRCTPSARDYAEALLGPVAGRQLLELAAGAGATTLRLAEHGAWIVATELSLAGLQALGERAKQAGLAGRIARVRCDARRLPFADASFDLVTGENFLMYVDPARLGRECRRVLRPGGRAVLLEPTAHHPLVRLYRLLASPYRRTGPRYFTLGDLPDLAAPFATTTHREFYLLSVLALPLARWPRLFTDAVRLLDALDRVLIRRWPGLARLGWLTVIGLEG